MTTEQFWLNWGATVAAGVATLLAVAVALFGQSFRDKFFPPKLSLSILNPKGDLGEVRTATTSEKVRYYHLAVTNGRRWAMSRNVQVFLTRIDEEGANGEFQLVWAAQAAMRWRHQEFHPVLRNIGPLTHCDLVAVNEKGKQIAILVLYAPFNMPQAIDVKTPTILYLEARGDEGDSSQLKVKVSWDGVWKDGEEEMARHLIVEEVG